ncbi:UxaA family hydrolase [Parvularcula sp. LCG005]|uniref:UxaA family hydrolase n=1 Tax=Parvularcula sp. LCG005 TaxID=3078805 RepID=UPI002942CF05|nr:UxaA family hydrolase [Parvularcula sp. LCG005]WOI54812.1 UxaA family hydrolase [Parvularcula sp. LCG005]
MTRTGTVPVSDVVPVRTILLHPTDNVVLLPTSIEAGQVILVDAETFEMPNRIGSGHKIARQDMKMGEEVVKYGAPIGIVTHDVKRGDHLHTHNMASQYISTHDRGDAQDGS